MQDHDAVFRTVTLAFENDESANAEFSGLALDAVINDSGYSDSDYLIDVYTLAVNGKGQESLHTFAEVVGIAIRDCIMDRLEEFFPNPSDPMRIAIWDLFDFGNRELWTEIGHQWLPDSADVRQAIAEKR